MGHTLVLKNNNGFWEFPGGGVEFGEDPQRAAKRELKEETGLSSSGSKFVCITSSVYKKDGFLKHAVYIVYACNVKRKNVRLTKEHSEYRWLKPGELRKLSLGANVVPIVQHLC